MERAAKRMGSASSVGKVEEVSSPLSLLGVDLSRYTASMQALVCVFGVFIGFGGYQVLQEQLFKVWGFRFPVMHTVVQTLSYSLLAFAEYRPAAHARDDSTGTKDGRDYSSILSRLRAFLMSKRGTLIQLSVLVLLVRLLSNLSLNYLDVSVKILVQSLKLLPIMLFGTLMLGKRYSLLELALAVVMVAGLVGFSLNDRKDAAGKGVETSVLGVALISTSVICDALKESLNERLFALGSTAVEIALFSNLFAATCMLPFLLVSGELAPAFEYLQARPHVILLEAVLFAFGHAGSQAALVLVQVTNSLTSSVVNNVRKALSVVLSIVLFGKTVSLVQIGSLVVFFAAAFVQLGNKPVASRAKKDD